MCKVIPELTEIAELALTETWAWATSTTPAAVRTAPISPMPSNSFIVNGFSDFEEQRMLAESSKERQLNDRQVLMRETLRSWCNGVL